MPAPDSGRVLPAQELHGDLAADPPPLEFQLDRPERVLAQHQVRRAVGEYQQDTHRRALAPEVRQQIDGRGVGPVQVVQEQDQGPQARHFLQEDTQLAFQAFLRSPLASASTRASAGISAASGTTCTYQVGATIFITWAAASPLSPWSRLSSASRNGR